MSSHNIPLCLINRLFSNLVHHLLGVVEVEDFGYINLEYLESREVWVLEIKIDCQDGEEFGSLTVHILLSRILCSSCLNFFMCIMDITHERIFSGGGYICHKIFSRGYVDEMCYRKEL